MKKVNILNKLSALVLGLGVVLAAGCGDGNEIIDTTKKATTVVVDSTTPEELAKKAQSAHDKLVQIAKDVGAKDLKVKKANVEALVADVAADTENGGINRADKDGNTLLHLLMIAGDQRGKSKNIDAEVLDVFVNAGAKLDAKNKAGLTPYQAGNQKWTGFGWVGSASEMVKKYQEHAAKDAKKYPLN